MDKASDFESEDCEFESCQGLPLFRLHINVTNTKNKTVGKIKNNVVQTLIAKLSIVNNYLLIGI